MKTGIIFDKRRQQQTKRTKVNKWTAYIIRKLLFSKKQKQKRSPRVSRLSDESI